jgi:hypothetical protein
MSNEEGVPGEEASSSPGLLANLLARGPMVQVGQQCPVVKRECPAARHRAGRSGQAIRA